MLTFFIKPKRRRTAEEYDLYLYISTTYRAIVFFSYLFDFCILLCIPFLLVSFHSTIIVMLKMGALAIVFELLHKLVHKDYIYFE